MSRRFWQDEQGQDLVEYSLLLAFVALCAVGILSSMQTATSGLWSTANVDLASAQTAAS